MVSNGLEGVPLLRPPLEWATSPTEPDREPRTIGVVPELTPVGERRLPDYYRPPVAQRLVELRSSYAMIGPALGLSVVLGIAIAHFG